MIANAFTAAGTVFWFIVFLAIFLIVAVAALILVGEIAIHLWRNRKEIKKKFLRKKKHRDVVAVFESTKSKVLELSDEGTRHRAMTALENAFQIEDDDEAIEKIRSILDHANKLISQQNPNANKEA